MGESTRTHDGPAAVVDEISRKTYRYLRVAIVGLALLLGAALVIEMVWGEGERYGSISGYYYSPVRSIFVGALLATGPALVAIKGRTGWEDTLLDLAGMLAPVVALVPTPLEPGQGGHACPPGVARCVPEEFVPAVANNIAALAVVGVVGVAFAWFSAGRAGRRDRAIRTGLVAATGVWVVFVAVFVLARDTFLVVAHYAAAITFFCCIAAVAWRAGREVREREEVAVLAPSSYGRAYRAISGLMVAVIVLAVVYLGLAALTPLEEWFATVLVVEAVLLVLFVVFWVLQTAENWHVEAAVEAAVDEAGKPTG